ncbi:MAG TPA: hypothetical protein VMF35_07490 [Acidimicrobiales bacterium]|nr:hypothetical protein [Acidimicrobiales bacterium]
MQIGVPQVRRLGPDVEYSVPYSMGSTGRADLPASLWYRVPADYEEMVSPRTDAALVALLIPAMVTGGSLHVEGPVTDELVFRLGHGFQEVLQAVIPTLRQVEVIAPQQVPAGRTQSGVAAGFSAGVDSFTVLADHFYDPDVPPALRITHLLFHRLGSHDDAGDAEHALFLDRLHRAGRVADKIGLPLIPVDSNVMDAYRGTGFDYQQTHTPRSASVAFLLQHGLGRWFYASSLHFAHTQVSKYFDTCLTDPISLPLLSTSSLVLESQGGEYTRFEKTMRIAEIPDTYWSLDVCVTGTLGTNCSKCFKCLRTLASLEIGGVLDRYEEVFDLDVYRQHRDTYFALAHLSRDQLVKELLVEAKRRGFAVPRPTLRRVAPTVYQHAKSEAIRHGERLLKKRDGTG